MGSTSALNLTFGFKPRRREKELIRKPGTQEKQGVGTSLHGFMDSLLNWKALRLCRAGLACRQKPTNLLPCLS
jgi:hypothetical protein